MISRVTNWLLLLAVMALAAFLSGCATDEPENASVRPWNTPQGWEGGLGGMNTQHR
ncbi:MAG TPA: hypothetical protein VGI63_06945 [Verrucomicrobiae bacterium]|jgi:hypothetical protein